MMKSHDNLEYDGNRLIGYRCKLCNGYNDITQHGDCIYCQAFISSNLDETVKQLSYAIRLLRTGEFHFMKHEELIELHTKFFNAEKIAIKDLDDLAKSERRELLRLIVVEAKAKLTAHDEDEREQSAAKAKVRKDWLLSSSSADPLISDAIGAVKERKKRMSEADKLQAKLSNLGVSGKELDEIVATAIRNKTGAAITSPPYSAKPRAERAKEQTSSASCLGGSHKGCDGTFRLGGESISRICDCKCHKPKIAVDLSKISFKAKS